MTGLIGIPRVIRWTVALGLLGLALAVPFSAPDGTGMQWDELVLACVAGSAVWSVLRLIRGMDPAVARPWWVIGVGAALFMAAQLLAGLFPGPEFDGFGIDDVVLLAGASSPVITCALLARQVPRTRWTALVVDGGVVTVALLVVTEVLRTPLFSPVGARDDVPTLVLTYGAYAAVVLGGAGALCTVSTVAMRRSATVMIAAVAWQAFAACAEAMAIVAPSMVWTAMSDVCVALGLQTVVLAAAYAPKANGDRSARATAPHISPWGMALVVLAMLGVPLAIGYGLLTDRPHSQAADAGVACLLLLIAIRLGMRIREDSRVTEDLVRNDEDFRSLVESSSDGVAIVDAELFLLFTSPAAREMLGLVPDGVHDCSLLDLVHADDRALVRASIKGRGGSGPVLHFRVVREDDAIGELEATTTLRPGSDRRVLYLRDVTSRRSRERELERMAYTDHLTALPNRAQLFEEMAAPATAPRCLLVLDLDGFKAVNDVAGHEAGDQLLVEVARRLHTVIREDDLVARLGGDEFAILVTGSLGDATEVAQRVVDVLGMPHRVRDWTFAVGASVGVATLGEAGGQMAFREADTALRAAKQAGKGCVRIADQHVPSSIPEGVDLATLIAEGTFTVRFDAACDAEGGIDIVHGVPVWDHVVHGTVRSQELWGAAERQGMSADLQRWLLRRACVNVAGLPDERVAVAVSLPAGHVTAEGLSEMVADALAESGLAPSRLILSFTEETLLTSSAALVPELETARRTGVRLCLDNYGMGHSLFALLARISLDVVRVDLSALAVRDDTDRALQVLASIVRSTADFGLVAIAGGVPTTELSAAAFAVGADLVHGRCLPRDLSTDDVAGLLDAVPAS
jgi:diguanylate cyclase (GGDEF)-like protein/PAS domain S-box-containing protein